MILVQAMATFVLVHGGWHGGWCWDTCRDILTEQGHTVYAPTLTGLAERAHLIDQVESPETHVADITQLMEFHDLSNVTLAGHSYGGIVITGAASRMAHRISHLVYLDAFVPTQSGMAPDKMANPERAAEMAAARAASTTGHVPPSGFHRWAKDPKTIAWLKSKTTDHPSTCFGKGVELIGDPFAVPRRSFILCNGAHPTPFWQFHDTYKDDPDWEVHQLDCLHDAMIEMPEELCALLTN